MVSDDEFWDLSWTELTAASPIAPFSIFRNYSVSGTQEEIIGVLLNLLKKQDSITEVNLVNSLSNIQRVTGPDGHYHTMEGVAQTHSWSECPENNKSENFYTHEGREKVNAS